MSNPDHHPTLDNFRQHVSASLQGIAAGPHALQLRHFSIARLIVLDKFVVSPAQGSSDIVSYHGFLSNIAGGHYACGVLRPENQTTSTMMATTTTTSSRISSQLVPPLVDSAGAGVAVAGAG